MYNVNEEPIFLGTDIQLVSNGDIIEFGGYSCVLSDDFGNNVWTTSITPVSVPSSTTSIVSVQKSNINTSVYPNPTNDYAYLSINGIEGTISLKITDAAGKLMQTEQFNVNSNTLKPISVNGFAKGVYFIHLQNDNTILTQKLIVY
jgi:hypothetical protein